MAGRPARASKSAAALLCAAAVLGGAAPAGAQRVSLPPYGGGALTPAAPLVALRALPTRTQVVVDAEAIARCTATMSVDERMRVRATLRGGRTFAAVGTRAYEVSRFETRSVRLLVRGRMIDATRAAGTLRVLVKVRRVRGPQQSCDSGSQPWQARAVTGAPPQPGPAPSGAALYGSTFQGGRFVPFPLALRVSADATRVQSAIFRVFRRCRGASSDDVSNNMPPAPVVADGRFTVTQRYSERYSDAVEEFTFRFSGRFTAAGAEGTLRATSLVRSLRSRAITGRCDSGSVRWVAHK